MASGKSTRTSSKTPRIGTFPDATILELGRAGKLITDNFSEKNVKQACYELRASDIYYEPPDAKPKQVADKDYILIKPKQLVVIITLEEISLENDVLGRILTKGQLFSAGLLPVNTYADPGFSGRLGIVLCNISNDYLKITPGSAIAKIEFSRLEQGVEHPYDGQHGYQSKMWPIPTWMILDADERKREPRIGSAVEELEQSYGPLMGMVMKRVFKYERSMLISAAVYLLCTCVLISLAESGAWKSTLVNLGLGVASSVVVTFMTFKATDLRRK